MAPANHTPFISPAWGFCDPEASLATLPPTFDELLIVAKSMGSMLKEHRLRPYFNQASAIHLPTRLTERQERSLFTVYAMLASAYLFSTEEAEELHTIPQSLATPLYSLAIRLGVPPILSYDAYILSNFTQDRRSPEEPESYTPLFTFSSAADEDLHESEKRFIATRVATERIIGPCVANLLDTLEHLEQGRDSINVLYYLQDMDRALTVIAKLMPSSERKAPGSNPIEREAQWYLRPFNGVIFEGVAELQGKPQVLRGASDGQSPTPYALEAFLGLNDGTQPDPELMSSLRQPHRQYIEQMLKHKSLKDNIDARPELMEVYNSVFARYSEIRQRTNAQHQSIVMQIHAPGGQAVTSVKTH
ncbi:hypothetical protein GQ53DRAFT_744031 [Thozetella sp. PMI_491]|nr:hypothetical protein GQ53DRAFT_744031 [Thozetella sp. PMI_491]